MATNSTSWRPPNIEHVSFDHSEKICDILATWSANWLVSENGDIPYPSTSKIVQLGLAAFWKSQELKEEPSRIEVFNWVADQRDEVSRNLTSKILAESSEHCNAQLCARLRWMGVSDLAGRGMIATYFIQCILITAFFSVHVASRFGWKPHRRTMAGRVLIAVQESSRPFLDATLLFCVALNLAAVGTLSRNYTEDRETVTMIMSSVYISLYSVFPASILHSCAARHLRRRNGRRYLWSFIAMLVLSVGIMYFCSPQSAPRTHYTLLRDILRNPTSPTLSMPSDVDIDKELTEVLEKDDEKQLIWEALCLDKQGVVIGYWTIVGLAAFLVISATLSLTFVTNIFRIPFLRSERSLFLKKLRQHWWMISAIVGMVFMWATIILFCILRGLMNKGTGPTNQDSKWTFGQILAVATWAPVLMEIFIIWRDGPEKGLSGLMSDRFEVYEVVDLGGERVIKSQINPPL